MRILVHEFAVGGGFAGEAVPASLAREGSAMLTALVVDLASIGHRIVRTADARFPIESGPDVEVVELSSKADEREGVLDTLIASADAAWFVAPETGGRLERLVRRAESCGTPVVGPGSATIRRVSDKAGLGRRLRARGLSYPTTRVLSRRAQLAEWEQVAGQIGYPLVAKLRRGAGCEGTSLVRRASELGRAIEAVRHAGGRGSFLLQEYIPGVPASVALLGDGRRAMALTANAQAVEVSSGPFEYRGGETPLEHPISARAIDVAVRTCEALRGLKGYVGVDVVLTDSEAVVIEVNPRLTTAYLGVRAALDVNVAGLALEACAGTLPSPSLVKRSVRFTEAGEIVLGSAPAPGVRTTSLGRAG